MVFVINSTPDGLGEPYLIEQSPVGSNKIDNRFGSTLVVGDFNADGVNDLAVGVPGED